MGIILQLRNVNKSFGSLDIIRGVNLDIQQGERHAIIGPNGAGKTTLTNLISMRLRPTSGRILFKGKDITRKAPFQLVREGVSRSFQIINVFKEMTVFENLRNAVIARYGFRSNPFRNFANIRGLDNEIETVLKLIGLVSAKRKLASELPYGEQRVLEIGLTLASNPELILLDEPAAGLSAAETRDVTALIRKVTEGRTLILIEHDMDVVFSLAEKISVLNYGEILAQGTPEDIRGNSEVKEVYLGYRND